MPCPIPGTGRSFGVYILIEKPDFIQLITRGCENCYKDKVQYVSSEGTKEERGSLNKLRLPRREGKLFREEPKASSYYQSPGGERERRLERKALARSCMAG